MKECLCKVKAKIPNSRTSGEKMKTEDYEPYGDEWEKEMMKWTKPMLISFLKKTLKEKDTK